MSAVCTVSRPVCRPRNLPARSQAGSGSMWRSTWGGCAIGFALVTLITTCFAQEPAQSSTQPVTPDVNTQLPVNWLYGAYVPKDVPLVPLNGQERFKLYIRQTYTTPGIYIKTGFFAVHDQVRDTPPGVGGWILPASPSALAPTRRST